MKLKRAKGIPQRPGKGFKQKAAKRAKGKGVAEKQGPVAKGAQGVAKKAKKVAGKQRGVAGRQRILPKVQSNEPAAVDDGRPLNARQDRFCREYVSGKTAREAYSETYGQMDADAADAASSRLLSSAKVRERVIALQKEAAAGAVLSLQEKRAYLRRVVVTAIGEVGPHSDLCQEYVRKEEGGARGRLRRGDAPAGNEVCEAEYEIIKIKMPDKLRAIELDAKLAGELRDQVEVSTGDGLTELLASIRSNQ